ncbi:MAG: 3-deoxy-manno-octulosonate cytidylyltransferase [Ponticaulis sp.]|nr:3-deoxy-manno-octulosonate cytidylyltransferase [Ponticaulis sp.]
MRSLIVVPARYGSTRFPGKPLKEIAGKSMVLHVADAAKAATELIEDAAFVVATDDVRIETHCLEAGVPVVMTPEDVASGTDRALAAVDALGVEPDVVINLQGDAPFTPAETIAEIGRAVLESGDDAATPVIRLSWEALDDMRNHKIAAPFSGTTCICGKDGRALWFSKSIIPAMRKEEQLRVTKGQSPVLCHVGLYAFSLAALKRFASLPESPYEELEGLEQLRMLEAGMRIRVVEVPEPEINISGVDTPEDLALLEKLLRDKGMI